MEVQKAFPRSQCYHYGHHGRAVAEKGFQDLAGDTFLNTLHHLCQKHPRSTILRIHPYGRMLPGFLFRRLWDHFEAHANRYLYLDLEELAFYHTFVELFSTAILPLRRRNAHATIAPDHVLNAFHLPGAAALGLTAAEARYFMAARFNDYFASPVGINIEISSVCNARCVMCHFDKKNGIGLVDDPPAFMPLSLFRKIVDEIAAWPRVPSLDLCWRGEPLMNPNFASYLGYARQKDVPLLMTTNGSLLTREVATQLLDLGLQQVVVSIDGATAATYEHIRRGLRYEQMRRNLERFIALKAKRNATHPLITVKVCAQEENEFELDDIVRMWLPDVDNVVVQNKGVYDKVSRRAYSYKTFITKKRRRVPCPQPFLIQSITAAGNVYDCLLVYSRDDPHMGNCQDNSLAALWRGKAVARKRQDLLAGRYDRLPICGGCDIPSTSATLKHEIDGNTLIKHKHFYKIYSKL